MSTQRAAWTRTRSASLTMSALLGLGLLGGCSGWHTTVGPAATLSARAVTSLGVPLSPTALVNAAAAAFRSARSVRIDSTATAPRIFLYYTLDMDASGGRQVLTYREGGQATASGRATVELVKGICYVEGDTAGLTGLIGIAPNLAGLASGRWIAVRPGEKLGLNDYDTLCSGFTPPSLADEITLTGKLSRAAPCIIDGQGVQGAIGTVPAVSGGGKGVLYMTGGAAPLPVEFRETTSRAQEQLSFSRWGEAVQLSVPANPIAAPLITPDSTTA
jgi:hypothetical protein